MTPNPQAGSSFVRMPVFATGSRPMARQAPLNSSIPAMSERIAGVIFREPVSRAHGERFGAIQPANTLVEARLIGDGYLVEIEAEAIIA